MDKLKVLVVDDSVVYRKILSEAVEATGIAVVEHSASNGFLALERLRNGKYDVVLLDINMPELDGIETLKRIKSNWPGLTVIMVSSSGGGSIKTTFESLKNGAMDFVLKPLEQDIDRNREILKNNLMLLFQQIRMDMINAIISPDTNNTQKKTDVSTDISNIPKKTGISPDMYNTAKKTGANNIKCVTDNKSSCVVPKGVDIVLVAASTGGPVTLERLFTGFKESPGIPLLIVQHMPPDFTRVMAESLSKKTNLCFTEGKEGDILRIDQCIVAPGGYHMMVSKDGYMKKISLSKSEYVNGVRPSADVLFKSVAEEYHGARVLAVILTGMGSDGCEGVRELKKMCSCYCITQSEKSCVVYGMPRCVMEAGLSDEVSDISDMAVRIQHIIKYGS